MNGAGPLDVFGATDTGCVRANNEDAFAIDEELGLLIVADGMGGHRAGEVASALAVKTVLEVARTVSTPSDAAREPKLSQRARRLEWMVRSANAAVFERSRTSAVEAGMGTTIVAVLVDGRGMSVAHVGDSRLYVYRAGRLVLLTADHSVIGEQLRGGLISPEAAAKSPFQHVLSRALGPESSVKGDVADHALLPGDLLLLCTDGLTKMVNDEDIRHALAAAASPQAIIDRLIQEARSAGGEDNITVIAARVKASQSDGVLARAARSWLSKVMDRPWAREA